MEKEGMSGRAAADKIGCSPATLTRMLQGSASPTTPDLVNLMKAASWLGKSISEFELAASRASDKWEEVEVHLRALPGILKSDATALVALVKAARDHATKPRSKKG